jgi:hypothetical protein
MIGLLLTLALCGLIVYLIVTYIPMPQIFKTAILVIAAVMVILYLMSVLGIHDFAIPKLR